MNPNALLFATIAGAGNGNDFEDRFLDGDHVIALNNMSIENSQDHGQFIAVDFIVLESTVPGYAGKAAGEAYSINKSDKEGGKGAKQRLNGLGAAAVASLGGNPDDQTPAALANGQPSTMGSVLVQNTQLEMCGITAPANAWRGLVLRASGRKRTGKNSGKEYVAVKYAPVAQTPQQIGEVRKRIESAASVPAPMIASAPAPVAQTTQYASPMAAPMAAPMVASPAVAPTVGYAPAPVAAPAVAPAQPFGGPSLLGNR